MTTLEETKVDAMVEPATTWGDPLPAAKPARTAKRKPKPYELLRASQRLDKGITAEKKAEKKADKPARKTGVAKAKASKPGGKLAKATLNVAKRKAAVKTLVGKGAKVKLNGTGKTAKEGICSICGKPLSRHTSVTNGMGDTCAAKIKLLPKGVSLEQHYEGLTVMEIPTGYIMLKEAIAKAMNKGTSKYRFLQATGGDRHIRKPFSNHFKVVYVGNKRYVPKSSLEHLKELVKV
jgi:hypothetical protein